MSTTSWAASPEIVREISPIDPMYAVGPEAYLRAGEEALRCITLAMLAAGKDRVDSVLDFGCAFGRVLRVLKAGFPEAHLTACDIRPKGIAFCAEAFGATPMSASRIPAKCNWAARMT